MNRNIILAYILGALRNSWFWLGIWVFYYLKFTNYAGIGLIETVLIITMTTMEIPTGAIADLLGKKVTLIISFSLQAISALLMAFAPNFNFLLISVFVGGIGGSLFSGTLEALVYDSLKEEKKEDRYSMVLGNITTFQFVMMAITGTIGGFVYGIDSRYPFVLTGIFYTFGFILAFLLKEPVVDSVKFSIQNFIVQNKQGFKQLFQNKDIKQIVILLLIISSAVAISTEMLDDILGVEFGFSPSQLGIFFSVLSLVGAGVSQFATKMIKKYFVGVKGTVYLGILIAVTYLFSPWAGIFLGGLTLVIRVAFQTVYNNMTSVTINGFTESKNRATTLSSFNMVKNLPYVLSAFFLGSLMDVFTAKKFALWLGIGLIILVVIQYLRIKTSNAKR